MATEILNLNITGMSCGHCEKRVKDTLERLDGVSNANISHNDASGHIEIEPSKITAQLIKDEIIKLGYKVPE